MGRGSSSFPPLHTLQLMRRTFLNRVYASVYTCAIVAMFYHRSLTLLHSTSSITFCLSFAFLISDAVLAFMWFTTQSFRMRPVRRQEFPEKLLCFVKEKDFPALDIFLCTADPYKEPPINVVNTALSVMAYDYPVEKLSVYVSDDGGSELTLFAFMEAAKFASHWLPFCRENRIEERCPHAYFRSSHRCTETEKMKTMYETMKSKVDTAMDRGSVPNEYIADGPERETFDKWTTGFTRHDHPTVIQVLVENGREKDMTGHEMPNLVYVSREKSKASPHKFKAGALNVLMGFRYGSLVEDLFTGYLMQCEGWKSVFCYPERAAFLGDVPISLSDVVGQVKRWAVGLLEILFSKYSPITFGIRSMGLLMGLTYSHYAFWPIWSFPVTFYAFVPQLALINRVSMFPEVSDPWFYLYMFLFLGAYAQDLLQFLLAGGTIQRWWNDQRMWMIRGISSHLFGTIDYFLKTFGISALGFTVTSKVMEDEQSKLYDHGVFEFGVSSFLFVPLTTAAIINLISFLKGLAGVFIYGNLREVFVQLFISSFVVLNCWPVYEAIALRSDRGKMPTKTTVASTLLAWVLYSMAAFILKT
ncbi:hypothetical protein NE237_029530 [Protea cynaroides]|uniref:Cellulose synthase-like protein G3 n=1 Tax=Protea cynaroides TaxID=273540 RepID=A0A9Q0JWC6_9MAGN|nr:hypothetical protein NE237_029530 [Protea cynaroides]